MAGLNSVKRDTFWWMNSHSNQNNKGIKYWIVPAQLDLTAQLPKQQRKTYMCLGTKIT